ncbi:MAG: hypothetical protein K2I72_03125 [Bacilli bacterium]|nr:hypothetical protein [Bacilli bacterium]
MDINYYMKIQNAYDTKNRREKELNKVNHEMEKHFQDTFGTIDVLLNDHPTHIMIIKDTDNNTFKKKIKSVHGEKLNLGDYIEWNKQKWLVTLLDVDDRTWNRGYMYLCTVPLRWQNSEGKIIERYVYSEDFTKYSNGITGNSTISIGDSQYGLTLPVDSETKNLKRDMRFPIDFDDSEQPDIYTLTNRKTKLNDNQYFGRGGTMIVTMSFDTFNPNDDKKVTMENGQEVWICNYNNSHTPLPSTPLIPDETTDLSAYISGNKNLKIGIPGIYTVNFTNNLSDGISMHNVDFYWNIVSDFYVEEVKNDNWIKIMVDDDSLIGESFLLQLFVDNIMIEEKKISIVDVI